MHIKARSAISFHGQLVGHSKMSPDLVKHSLGEISPETALPSCVLCLSTSGLPVEFTRHQESHLDRISLFSLLVSPTTTSHLWSAAHTCDEGAFNASLHKLLVSRSHVFSLTAVPRRRLVKYFLTE